MSSSCLLLMGLNILQGSLKGFKYFKEWQIVLEYLIQYLNSPGWGILIINSVSLHLLLRVFTSEIMYLMIKG